MAKVWFRKLVNVIISPAADQRLNVWTHGVGFMLVLLASCPLVRLAAERGSVAEIAGCIVFVASVLLMYLASTLCHSVRGTAQDFWVRADHGAIFILIAGSYTPFALVGIRSVGEWVVFALIWGIAILSAGQALKARPGDAPRLWSYLILGWITVAATILLAPRLTDSSLLLLLIGGGVYIAGTWFYRNVYGWRHAHGVWHLFVLGGTAAHFAAVAHAVGH